MIIKHNIYRKEKMFAKNIFFFNLLTIILLYADDTVLYTHERDAGHVAA